MFIKKVFVTKFLFLFLLGTSQVFAGAWTQQGGGFYYKIGFLRFKSTSQYLLNGEKSALSNNGSVTDLGIYQYLEYGISNDLTLIATVPFKKTAFDCAIAECNKSSKGLADIFLGLRYKLSEKNWVISLQSGIKMPPGYETNEEALESAPPLGDGQTDFEVRLLAGRPIFGITGYLNFDIGFRARSGEPVDEIPFAVEVGFNLTEHYILSTMIHGVRSISEMEGQQNFQIVNGEILNFVGTGALEDFVKVQLQFTYRMTKKLDLAFSFDQVLTGRNTSSSSTFGFGLAIHK